MAVPTKAEIDKQIGNATRELAPGTTWRYNEPGDGYATMAKATELAANPPAA